jgi:ribosomal-protein-alanine N-acetyltransferase
MRLETCGPQDLDALCSLEARAHPGGWSAAAIAAELDRDDAVVFALVDTDINGDDAIAAYAVVRAIVDERWILNIVTDPQMRRRGCGRRLLSAARDLPGPARSMWLEVREGNAAARALYVDDGFVVVGRRPDYYPGLDGGPREAALLMRRALP